MSTNYNEVSARPVASWTVSDVSLFLDHLSLPNLKFIFLKNGVNGKDLLAFSKQELKDELGCTELQARKISDAVAALSTAPAPTSVPTTTTTTTTTYQQPVMYTTAAAPGVVYNGYYYQPRERYIGGITVLIAVLVRTKLCALLVCLYLTRTPSSRSKFCFPCIFCWYVLIRRMTKNHPPDHRRHPLCSPTR